MAIVLKGFLRDQQKFLCCLVSLVRKIGKVPTAKEFIKYFPQYSEGAARGKLARIKKRGFIINDLLNESEFITWPGTARILKLMPPSGIKYYELVSIIKINKNIDFNTDENIKRIIKLLVRDDYLIIYKDQGENIVKGPTAAILSTYLDCLLKQNELYISN